MHVYGTTGVFRQPYDVKPQALHMMEVMKKPEDYIQTQTVQAAAFPEVWDAISLTIPPLIVACQGMLEQWDLGGVVGRRDECGIGHYKLPFP